MTEQAYRIENVLGVSTLILAFVLILSAATSVEAPLHFALSKSAPAAGATVEAPPEIRLWFTEEPQEGTTTIRLVEAAEVPVPVTEVAQDSEDPRSFFVELQGTLPPGTYTVSWRGMGQDGHVVRDSFVFSVAGR